MDLALTSGVPYSLTATVTGGAATFAAGHQVYGQIRNEAGGTLIRNLAQDLASSISGSDIIVTLTLTGKEVRSLTEGVYDIFIAEPGTEEAQAVRILHGGVALELVASTPPPVA
jgi:hypothetical protein